MVEIMSNGRRRLFGTDAKVRRGDGWGGKGSHHPSARGYLDVRRYGGYQSKPGRSGKPWQSPHHPRALARRGAA